MKICESPFFAYSRRKCVWCASASTSLSRMNEPRPVLVKLRTKEGEARAQHTRGGAGSQSVSQSVSPHQAPQRPEIRLVSSPKEKPLLCPRRIHQGRPHCTAGCLPALREASGRAAVCRCCCAVVLCDGLNVWVAGEDALSLEGHQSAGNHHHHHDRIRLTGAPSSSHSKQAYTQQRRVSRVAPLVRASGASTAPNWSQEHIADRAHCTGAAVRWPLPAACCCCVWTVDERRYRTASCARTATSWPRPLHTKVHTIKYAHP